MLKHYMSTGETTVPDALAALSCGGQSRANERAGRLEALVQELASRVSGQ